MKIGCFLFPESRDPAADARVIRETIDEALLAEDLGVDAIFLAEHHFDGNCAYVDPPVFAGSLAAMTRRAQIGFAVIQTSLYHPLRLAEQLSLLDHLSEGRLIIGLGRGSLFNPHEYTAYEVDQNEAQARFEEIEDILLRCWTEERVVHRGRFWNFEIPSMRPRPYSDPYPLIMRGTASEASLLTQARRGWPVMLPNWNVRTTIANCDAYRKASVEAGFSEAHATEALAKSWVFMDAIITETDEDAVKIGLPYVRQMQEYRASMSPTYRQRFPSGPVEAVPAGTLCGSPSTVLKQLEGLADSGIGGMLLRLRLGPMPASFATRSLRLLMSEIAPVVRVRGFQQALDPVQR